MGETNQDYDQNIAWGEKYKHWRTKKGSIGKPEFIENNIFGGRDAAKLGQPEKTLLRDIVLEKDTLLSMKVKFIIVIRMKERKTKHNQ